MLRASLLEMAVFRFPADNDVFATRSCSDRSPVQCRNYLQVREPIIIHKRLLTSNFKRMNNLFVRRKKLFYAIVCVCFNAGAMWAFILFVYELVIVSMEYVCVCTYVSM